MEKYREEYARLNVAFDVYLGESQVGAKSMNESLARLETMGLITENEGAKVVDLEKYKLGKAVVRKKGKHISIDVCLQNRGPIDSS